MKNASDFVFPEFPLLLAPMEDVTNPPFRLICRELGADVVYTEFISSEGLIRDAEKSKKKLGLNEAERPVGIQIFGHNEESMRVATEMAEAALTDFIDLNFGCPVSKVISKGAGAAMLRTVPAMISITSMVVKQSNIPVTAKTRIGWDEKSKNIVEVAEMLQDAGIKALTIHGRTRAQMYKGEADWTLIGEVKNNPSMTIPIFGNGDIDSPEKALEMKNRYGVDGLMIGRAIIGYPWLFREVKHFLNYGLRIEPPSVRERVELCKRHIAESMKYNYERYGFLLMRKHYSGYFRGLPDFKQFRLPLVTASCSTDIIFILEKVADFYDDIGV